MTSQPEALRLAEWFDEEGGFRQGTKAPHKWVLQAAAELRRLHELNEELLAREKRWMELADVEVARCDKLQAINAQLLEALEGCLDYGGMTGGSWVEDKVRAAIAAARKTI